jgi:hypothetical protein
MSPPAPVIHVNPELWTFSRSFIVLGYRVLPLRQIVFGAASRTERRHPAGLHRTKPNKCNLPTIAVIQVNLAPLISPSRGFGVASLHSTFVNSRSRPQSPYRSRNTSHSAGQPFRWIRSRRRERKNAVGRDCPGKWASVHCLAPPRDTMPRALWASPCPQPCPRASPSKLCSIVECKDATPICDDPNLLKTLGETFLRLLKNENGSVLKRVSS